MFWKTAIMLGIICFLALVIMLDFFIALPKFGAEHFGAPTDLKEMIKKIPDKPKYVVVIGLIIMILSFLGIIGDFVWAAMDTYINYPGFWFVFLRFLILLWGYKFFDILCFDWLLMTKIRLPEKLCPETKGAKGYDSFGFNAKSQGIKLGIYFVVSLLIAALYLLLCEVIHG